MRSLCMEIFLFQSTLPVWGATAQTLGLDGLEEVFQSTLPVWGATAYRAGYTAADANFNPRSPCGERR